MCSSDLLNQGTLERATHEYHEDNPLCGDELTLQLFVEQDRVKDVKFSGKGCAISIASASLLTEEIKGKSLPEVRKLSGDDIVKMLGIPLGPVRMKCALLCFDALLHALGGRDHA